MQTKDDFTQVTSLLQTDRVSCSLCCDVAAKVAVPGSQSAHMIHQVMQLLLPLQDWEASANSKDLLLRGAALTQNPQCVLSSWEITMPRPCNSLQSAPKSALNLEKKELPIPWLRIQQDLDAPS